MRDNSSKDLRFSGVLLHPTCLPNENLCGGFGKESRTWLRLLAQNGIGVWQFLPLSPADSMGSPYSSPSSFALNPWFLDYDDLIAEGFLLKDLNDILPDSKAENNSFFTQFDLADLRSKTIGKALRENWESQPTHMHSEFKAWCLDQFWLEDHSLFMTIRDENNKLPWWEWPSHQANYNDQYLSEYKDKNIDCLIEHSLIQWHLSRQWKKLRELAKELGVLLFGDLPFYVSRDSSDVWSNKSLFSVFSDGSLFHQSGVPPDYFSDTGQLWGSPVYRWRRHALSRYRWWNKRFESHFELVDLLRIDHFRAFKACWKVSGRDETAQNGFWSPSPGLEILSKLQKKYGKKLPLVAEDLGVITEDVEKLRDYFNLPGMKILQFAFDGNLDNPYLPENITDYKSIVYTGTHDNPTTNGWWEDLDDDTKGRVNQRILIDSDEISWKLIEMGLSTKACLFIAPVQDLLSLKNQSRLNTPGTISGNWSWRLDAFDDSLINSMSKFGNLSALNGRGGNDIFELTQC